MRPIRSSMRLKTGSMRLLNFLTHNLRPVHLKKNRADKNKKRNSPHKREVSPNDLFFRNTRKMPICKLNHKQFAEGMFRLQRRPVPSLLPCSVPKFRPSNIRPCGEGPDFASMTVRKKAPFLEFSPSILPDAAGNIFR